MAIAFAKTAESVPCWVNWKIESTTNHIDQSCQDTKEKVLENFGSHEGSQFSYHT